MNGKKVLNRLINLFLVFNIILLVINYVNRGNEYVLSQERMDNIIRLLEKEGISIDVELIREYTPKYTASLLYIGDSVSVREQVVKQFFGNNFANVKRSTMQSKKSDGRNIFYYTFDQETLAFDHNELTYKNESMTMDEERPNIEVAKSMCDQFVQRLGLDRKSLTYTITPESFDTYWKLTYYPVIENIPILDSYMEFIVGNSGVMKANMYLADVEVQTNSRQNIYAVDLVLFGIEDYMLDSGYTSIEDITMCYKREQNEDNVLGQEIIPVYKIMITGLEEPIFVNAYTNKMLEYHT